MVRILPGALALAVLASACMLPLGSKSGVQISFAITVPKGMASTSGARLVAAESATFQVIDLNPSGATQNYTFPVVLNTANGVSTANVSFTTSLGMHTFTVTAFDANQNPLTRGQTPPTLISADSQVSVSLRPVVSLSVGDTINLKAFQVGYYTVPKATAVTLNGFYTAFWELAPDGSLPGKSSDATITINAFSGEKFVRALQSDADGSFQVDAAASAGVQLFFTNPTTPTISIGWGSTDLDATKSDTLLVDPQMNLNTGLNFVKWSIDGVDAYPDATPFSVDPSYHFITVESAKYADSPGMHEVVVYLTDGVHLYSANVTFTVISVAS